MVSSSTIQWQQRIIYICRKRRYRFWISAFGLIAILSLTLLFWFHDTRPEFVVAFVERNAYERDIPTRESTARFERLHRITFADLIGEWNSDKHNPFRLRLLDPDPAPLSDDPNALKKRYQELKKLPNLVAVFDNCWGSDIMAVRPELLSFPVPIVFLNADHNAGLDTIPENLPYGKGRFFVGNSDRVPTELAALLPKLMDSQLNNTPATQADFMFVSEQDYALTQRFDAIWNSGSTLRPAHGVILPSLGDDSQKAASVRDAVREEIRADFKANGAVEDMQSRRKLLVLNSHARWGKELIDWLDSDFNNITVIAYQSSVSTQPDFSFGREESSNELILLTLSSQTIPPSLFLRYSRLQRQYPDVFARQDAPFFLRRCVLSMEMCCQVLRKFGGAEMAKLIDPATHSLQRDRLIDEWETYRAGNLHSSFGEHRFTRLGEVS